MRNRRSFLRTSAMGGCGIITAPVDQLVAAATGGVKRPSGPSNLKITDLRYVTVEHLGRPCSILRIVLYGQSRHPNYRLLAQVRKPAAYPKH